MNTEIQRLEAEMKVAWSNAFYLTPRHRNYKEVMATYHNARKALAVGQANALVAMMALPAGSLKP